MSNPLSGLPVLTFSSFTNSESSLETLSALSLWYCMATRWRDKLSRLMISSLFWDLSTRYPAKSCKPHKQTNKNAPWQLEMRPRNSIGHIESAWYIKKWQERWANTYVVNKRYVQYITVKYILSDLTAVKHMDFIYMLGKLCFECFRANNPSLDCAFWPPSFVQNILV